MNHHHFTHYIISGITVDDHEREADCFHCGPSEDRGHLVISPPSPPRAFFHLPVLVIATRRLQEFLRHMLAVIGLVSTSASH